MIGSGVRCKGNAFFCFLIFFSNSTLEIKKNQTKIIAQIS